MGGIYEINGHLFEGRYTPTNAHGKREAHNIYAKTKKKRFCDLSQYFTAKLSQPLDIVNRIEHFDYILMLNVIEREEVTPQGKLAVCFLSSIRITS